MAKYTTNIQCKICGRTKEVPSTKDGKIKGLRKHTCSSICATRYEAILRQVTNPLYQRITKLQNQLKGIPPKKKPEKPFKFKSTFYCGKCKAEREFRETDKREMNHTKDNRWYARSFGWCKVCGMCTPDFQWIPKPIDAAK